MRFKVFIQPKPKGRPRFNMQTRRTFTPKSTSEFQKSLRFQIIRGLGLPEEKFPIYKKGIPLALDVDFVYSRPQRLMKKSDPNGYLWRPLVDDLDNLEKSVMDALNNILWHDDRQICQIRSRKVFGFKHEDSHICINIRPLDEDNPPEYLCDIPNRPYQEVEDERSE